jgi:predicted aldo/keto reductase-like oxidoreductase
MSDQPITRRDFMEKGALTLGAAGLAARTGFAAVDTSKIPSYNPKMEYRPLGKTGMHVSAVCLGGHWKRLKAKGADFDKNRYDTVTRCMERGINYIDACWNNEVRAYSKALKGRRDKMFLGFSWGTGEMRFADSRTEEKLLATLENGLKECELEYTDLWRITMHEKSSDHTEAEIEQMMKALEKAKKQGKARFVGFSSHDRPHIKGMLETYSGIVDAICTPYTAKTKELPQDSMFETVKKLQIGVFGIKPFSSNAIFKGDGQDEHPKAAEDSETARMALRYILCNPLVVPIPGLISDAQVDNAAKAVEEWREQDKPQGAMNPDDIRKLDRIHEEAWARLTPDYQWLKQWEWV